MSKERAEEAGKNSGQAVADHFSQMGKMINLGKGAKRHVDDVHLSRYACYLIVQNADPSKPIVALGQTYFAVQTRGIARATARVAPTIYESRKPFRSMVGADLGVAPEAI